MIATNKTLADAIRFLSIDAINTANSGHPGLPMGMADIATILWTKFLNHNPKNPNWLNRDRFVLSNGHGSMLLYSLLHLSGYNVSIDDIKDFRQFHSNTPGHPEYGYTEGVETTTGPLGQGIANAVGMALAEKTLAAQFNKYDINLIDHYTYVFLGDGCLMEGISHEVCSLAGALKLNKLIAFWDDNNISIDGNVKGWWTDNTPERFRAYGWNVIDGVDGHNQDHIEQAIHLAKQENEKPTLICCKTIIGYGSPKAGTSGVHGSPLGAEGRKATAEKLGWKYAPFEISPQIYAAWNAEEKGHILETEWETLENKYKAKYLEDYCELKRRLANKLPKNLDDVVAEFFREIFKKMPNVGSRKSSQMVLEKLSPFLPEMFGGSADLTGSNLTNWSGSNWINNGCVDGNYLSYGVREFGMAAIMNGMSLYGGFRPYGGTFLVFSDYSRNAIRMSALMKQPVVYIMTHDSIGLGEDGPTHQPVEHVTSLRLIPNLNVWRPADTTETLVAWHSSLKDTSSSSLLVLSRQNLPTITNASLVKNIYKGGYVLSYQEDAKVTLVATGSEVKLVLDAQKELNKQCINSIVVSIPCVEKFADQSLSYKEQVISQEIPSIFVEASQPDIWYKHMSKQGGVVIGMTTFGESAPADILMKYFGFSIKNIINQVKKNI